MKLRYYMRGLGIGIVVTALIMGVTMDKGRPLSDAEIRAKALTLGMVDADDLNLSDLKEPGGPSEGPGAQGTGNPSESPAVQGTEGPSGNPEAQGTESPSGSPAPQQTEGPAESPEAQQTTTPPHTTLAPEETGAAETVTIRIVRGDSSYTVSRRLEEAGLVDDAGEYDTYLVNHGYAQSIRTGTYQIPVDASWEEIAQMIAA